MRKTKILLIFLPLILFLIGCPLSEEDKAKKKEAIALIQKIEEFPYTEEAKKSPEKFYKLFDELMKLGKPALPAIKEAMEKTKDQTLKAMYLQSSSEIIKSSPSPELTNRLIKTLQNKKTHPGIKGEAAITLGEIGGVGAYEALIATLSDENAEVRSLAALGLGCLRDDRAVQPLLNLLSQDDSSRVRGRAVRALGDIGDREAEASLIALLSDEDLSDKDLQVQGGAINVLGEWKSQGAVPSLIKIAKEEGHRNRYSAIKSLGKIEGDQAFNTLIELLQDKSGYIVWITAEILATIGDQRAAEPLAAAIREAASYDKEDLKKAYKDLTGQEYQE